MPGGLQYYELMFSLSTGSDRESFTAGLNAVLYHDNMPYVYTCTYVTYMYLEIDLIKQSKFNLSKQSKSKNLFNQTK